MQLVIVIFTVESGTLKMLLSGNRLPAADITTRQLLDDQAHVLFLRTTRSSAADSCFSEQLFTFSFPDEEKRLLVISYYFLLSAETIASGVHARFIPVSAISSDHPDGAIIRYALQRLRWKIEYTNVVYSLLPNEFTLGDLQKTYEAILGRVLDKRNFRKKIMTLKLVKPSGKTRRGTAGRGATLYAFRSHTPVRVKVF